MCRRRAAFFRAGGVIEACPSAVSTTGLRCRWLCESRFLPVLRWLSSWKPFVPALTRASCPVSPRIAGAGFAVCESADPARRHRDRHLVARPGAFNLRFLSCGTSSTRIAVRSLSSRCKQPRVCCALSVLIRVGFGCRVQSVPHCICWMCWSIADLLGAVRVRGQHLPERGPRGAAARVCGGRGQGMLPGDTALDRAVACPLTS